MNIPGINFVTSILVVILLLRLAKRAVVTILCIHLVANRTPVVIVVVVLRTRVIVARTAKLRTLSLVRFTSLLATHPASKATRESPEPVSLVLRHGSPLL